MQLNLNYVHSNRGDSPAGAIGYGRLGVKLAEALEAEGVEVFDHMEGPIPDDGIGAEGRNSGLAGSVLWVCTPPQAYGWWTTQQPYLLTMWEATQIPESFRENLHAFDTLLVPSTQNVEIFSEWHDNVQLVYLGIDPKAWHYVPRTPPKDHFDFLIGGSGSRKGTDLAYEAFLDAFPTPNHNGLIPRLFMKDHNGEFAGMHDRVRIVSGKIPDHEEIGLYESCHAYVQPSRGEGFGMQPLQAMAQGMPTILTDAHGHEAFAHLGHGIGYTMSKSDYFMYGEAGDWWEPDHDELVDTMRWVIDNYDDACETAKLSASVVAQDFTWGRTAQEVIRLVDCGATYLPGGEWHDVERLKYRIRTTSTRIVDIAGRRMRLEAGVDYWDTADTKRVLAENGCLDQGCIDEPDSGLADVQIERLGRRRPPPPDRDLTAWHAGAA